MEENRRKYLAAAKERRGSRRESAEVAQNQTNTALAALLTAHAAVNKRQEAAELRQEKREEKEAQHWKDAIADKIQLEVIQQKIKEKEEKNQ